MNAPSQDAQLNLDRALARGRKEALPPHVCLQMVEDLSLVPGYAKRVAHSLSAQRSAAAVEALRLMPPGVPGVVEGLHGAFVAGVSRVRADGSNAPPFLAIDFRRSRSKSFDALLHRAQLVFSDALEAFRVSGQLYFRFMIQSRRGTVAGRAAAVAHDLHYLHDRLGRLKGTRLWLNGWCFPVEGPFRPPVQVHLVRAWLAWAAQQTETRR
jgi:hypothetical protein